MTKAVLFLILAVCAWPLGAQDFSGRLYRRGSEKKELLFTLKAERRPELWADHYFDASGSAAITERVFLKDGQATRYEFDDRQQNGLGSVELQGAKMKLMWQQDGKTQAKTVDTPPDMTFGPLYPALLQRRFDDLLAGKTVLATVPVLSAAHLMTAQLSFHRKPNLEKGDGKVCVSMKPANWFVALFFPPIDLYFDGKTAALMDVHGMSLLKEKKGTDWKMTEIDLDYAY